MKNKYKEKYSDKQSKFNKKRIVRMAALLLFVLIIIIAGRFLLIPGPSQCTLEYAIKPVSTNQMLMEVTGEIKGTSRLGEEQLELLPGDVTPINFSCVDSKGRKLEPVNADGLFIIDIKGSDNVSFHYQVKLGESGKHGHRGGLYKDLAVFEGAQVFILPAVLANGSDSEIASAVERLSVKYDIPQGKTIAVPYPKQPEEGEHPQTEITMLTWGKIYDLMKSCYVFGDFDKKQYTKDGAAFTAYFDKSNSDRFSVDVEKGIAALFGYYKNLFGYSVDNLNIVFLRKAAQGGNYIMGGSGVHTIGATFDPDKARDWELLSHRLFHSFFDYKMTTTLYHKPPQLWFYEGITTYYENKAMDSLPDNLKKSLKLSFAGNMQNLFKRYLYMRLKDSRLFNIPAMAEEELSSSEGLKEFLHYTEGPLIIKAIEDSAYTRSKTTDNIIKYILDNSYNESLTVNDILYSVLGDGAAVFAQEYLYSGNIIPLWYMSGAEGEDEEGTVKLLNDFEYLLWTWFSQEIEDYPLDILSTDSMKRLSDKAEGQRVRFADKTLENKVREASPTVYRLLKQYALRAKVCKSSLDDPELRFKLFGDKSNIERWNEYKKNK